MTVALAVALQGAVFAIVKAAALPYGFPVLDEPPKKLPGEFIRLDGFEITDLSTKAGEQGQHHFEVHHFDRPVGEGLIRNRRVRSKTMLAVVHAALMAGRVEGARLHHEYLTVETDQDGVSAHGVSRYTVILR